LIVDDSPENLTVLNELLQPIYLVRAATSGQKALRIAGTSPRPDLILLDVMMPGMDGYQVFERLRALSAPINLQTGIVCTLIDPVTMLFCWTGGCSILTGGSCYIESMTIQPSLITPSSKQSRATSKVSTKV
jgi:hypothetical protein